MLSFGFLSTIVSFLQWRALLWSLSVYQYCTIRKHSFYLWFFLHASRVQKITSFDCTCLISHVPMCIHNHVGVFHTKKGRTAKRAALFLDSFPISHYVFKETCQGIWNYFWRHRKLPFSLIQVWSTSSRFLWNIDTKEVKTDRPRKNKAEKINTEHKFK